MSIKTEISRSTSVHTTRNMEYVGFGNFPNQVYRRCIKSGFDFTLMVVGQSGLGKSTFLNTLFLADIHNLTPDDPPELKTTVNIEEKTMRLVENDVRLNLTVVDTPGFGDLVNNADCWEPIVKYIDSKYSAHLVEETKLDRPPIIEDRRVHLCLYFIAPTGHGLKALDLEFLRALQDRVNIIPVIAKADTLTPQELARFKQNVINDLRKLNIQLYEFLESKPVVAPNGSQSDGRNALADFITRIPFAVVASTKIKDDGNRNRRLRVREYPWGTVEVDNLEHNDFIALRDAIIRNSLIDLIAVTNNVHYENFRARSMPKNNLSNDPFTQLENESRSREKQAEEDRRDKEQVFEKQVAAREQHLINLSQEIDAEESKSKEVILQKKQLIDKLQQEVADLRSGSGCNGSGNWTLKSYDSGSSIRQSPPEKAKKKGIFGMKLND